MIKPRIIEAGFSKNNEIFPATKWILKIFVVSYKNVWKINEINE